MSYKHFKPEQRNELAVSLRAGHAQKEIAIILDKTPSAVCQELKKKYAPTATSYDAGSAKDSAKQKRIMANRRFRKIPISGTDQRKIGKEMAEGWIKTNRKRYNLQIHT